MVNVAYAAHGKGRYKSLSQCYSCKEVGHIAKHCSKKFCNYCKKEGHIIKDCRVCPHNGSAPALYTAVQSTFVPTSSAQPNVLSSSSNLTPKQVQQVIVYALSTLGLQGKKHLLPSPWLIDFAASNHMTCSLVALHDVCKYDGEQYIQIIDGSTLPIIAVGNSGSSFTNVFMSPMLSANLISVRQLVEENCSLHFDRNGFRVHDQVLGQVIAKGHNLGRFFPLQSFSVPCSISVGCSAIANNSHFWKKKLGHPNSSLTNPVSSSILSSPFDDVSSTPTRFRPGIVYQRRCPLHLPSSEPPPDPVLHEPRRSTRVSRPLDWDRFSNSAF
ncbi:hypothetical protein LWI29_001019 [Acer saccharum]|uniref:CCHC-type domain-containing protein n=1 Tax=Acer saccharum TaxID=4024 RepID=A0AA39S7C6_ACESA|nr:hypothetical protein LWI29_001019 [Acer saccharum]